MCEGGPLYTVNGITGSYRKNIWSVFFPSQGASVLPPREAGYARPAASVTRFWLLILTPDRRLHPVRSSGVRRLGERFMWLLGHSICDTARGPLGA